MALSETQLNVISPGPRAVVAPVKVAASPQTGVRVRSFHADDIPEVIRLHQAAFRRTETPDLRAYRDYFTRVFLDFPSGDDRLPSLVYEEGSGRLSGFIGVVPRRIVVGGRRYLASISSQFVVDPASRVGLVALRLVKAYFEGPQDLSIADEANERSRAIWEGMGGRTALLLSIYWTRPLRPVRLAADRLRERGFGPVVLAASSLVAGADALAARLPGSYFRQLPSDLAATDVTVDSLLTEVSQLRDPSALHVDYDEDTLQWMAQRLATRAGDGRLLSAILRDGKAVVGWYVCVLDGEGTADVAQLGATPASIHRVLDHLFHEAWRHGAVSVTGRLEPRYMQALSDRYCLFHRRGPWVLVRASNPELVRAFEVGSTDFSRLDGEWMLRFTGEPI